MKTRALCLVVGLSIAVPLAAAEPPLPGDPCPFGPTDPQLWFSHVEGPLELEAPDENHASSGPLPCGFGVSIEDTRRWVGVDVAALPRHLAVTVDLNLIGLEFQTPDELVDVLQVLAPSGPGAESSVTVSLSQKQVYLFWRHDGETTKVVRGIPGPLFTLVLGVDRGRDSGSGLLTLSIPDAVEPRLELGPIDLESFPVAGSPAARVRVGVLGTLPIELGAGEARGRLRFRPVSIESGWGRR